MHPNVTGNNISWLHFSWATLYFRRGAAARAGNSTSPGHFWEGEAIVSGR